MRQITGTRKSSGEKIVKEIKRATCKHYSSGETIRDYTGSAPRGRAYLQARPRQDEMLRYSPIASAHDYWTPANKSPPKVKQKVAS